MSIGKKLAPFFKKSFSFFLFVNVNLYFPVKALQKSQTLNFAPTGQIAQQYIIIIQADWAE